MARAVKSPRKAAPQSPSTDTDDEHPSATPSGRGGGSSPKDKGGRLKSLKIRTITTVAMISGLILVVHAGHVPLAILLFTLQWMMVKELFALARVAQQDKKLPGFRAQQWYFFGVATFYLYIRFIRNNLLVEISTHRAPLQLFAWAFKYHSLLSYSLYTAGFVTFVLSLRKGAYLYQFGQYAWTHMILLVVFVPSSFFVSAIFQGLFWFLLPSALIIANDITAYLAGITFGRTPLIKLSPKKTWEGFAGGFVGTLAIAFWLSSWLSRYTWMTCPRKDLSLGPLHCTPADIYLPHTYTLRGLLQSGALPAAVEEAASRLLLLPPAGGLLEPLLSAPFTLRPVQLHALALACFASVIAPFGGFFASGFKRAFKMKDFGDTIPGHGGLTDRFDCQMMMAMFSYIYYWHYVAAQEVSVGDVLGLATKLEWGEQVELLGRLANLLAGQGLLPAGVADSVAAAAAAATGAPR